MQPILINSKGLMGVLVDTMTANGRNAQHAGELRRIQKIVEDANEDTRKIRGSDEWTPRGQRTQAQKRLTRALEEMQPHRQHVEQIEHQIRETRDRALAEQRGALTTEDLMVRREIRDRLMADGADPLILAPRYLAAIESGDHAFARAIETAPRAFPLVDDDALQKGSEAWIAKSRHADRLAEMQAERDVFAQVVKTAEQEITKAAQNFGVSLADVEAA